MKTLLKELKLELNETQEKQFQTFYEVLISENKQYNLTAITDHQEVLIKHFYDALTLTLVKDFNNINNVCDVGTGAGFPGIPLKIMFPHLKLYLIESSKKKTNFLKLVIERLGLKDIAIINERSEVFAEDNSNKFDLVVARAVSPLNILVELTLPLVKEKGSFVAMKGSLYKDELNLAKNGIITLGGTLNQVLVAQLPNDFGTRALIVIDKLKTIKGYPRTYAQIKKKPL